MTMIIDVHTHLGDLLSPNGGALIEKVGVRKKWYFDFLYWSEKTLWTRGGRVIPEWAVIVSGLARNASATRENLRAAMNKAGVTMCVTMPVAPNVTFADLHAAGQQDRAILAFTGVDYEQLDNIEAQFVADVARGAKGLKLHPILQGFRLNSPETFTAVEAFAPYNLPILFHAGECEYYLRRQKHLEWPEYGSINDAAALMGAFPDVNFIVGHAGLHRIDQVIELFSGYANVWVDISFQSPPHVEKLLAAFTAERVLYASDWPWGNMDSHIEIVKAAAQGDKAVERLLFYENAASLLKIERVKQVVG